MHPNVHCSTIYNSQDMEATEVISRGMNKHTHTHTHTHTQWTITQSQKRKKEMYPKLAQYLFLLLTELKLSMYHSHRIVDNIENYQS